MPRSAYSSESFCNASATSTCEAPVSFASASIESDSEATKRSASSERCSSPVSISSGCIDFVRWRWQELQLVLGSVLFVPQAALTNQLQDGEERRDDGTPVQITAQLPEFDASPLAYRSDHVVHLTRDREALARDRALLRFRVTNRGEERVGQTLGRDPV